MDARKKEKRVVNRPQGGLGWRSIKREIQMRKLMFWYRINKKTQESWVKQAAI